MMSHTFAICAYKDSPYLDACIHSLKQPVGEVKDHSLYFHAQSVSGGYGKDPRHPSVCAERKERHSG